MKEVVEKQVGGQERTGTGGRHTHTPKEEFIIDLNERKDGGDGAVLGNGWAKDEKFFH